MPGSGAVGALDAPESGSALICENAGMANIRGGMILKHISLLLPQQWINSQCRATSALPIPDIALWNALVKQCNRCFPYLSLRPMASIVYALALPKRTRMDEVAHRVIAHNFPRQPIRIASSGTRPSRLDKTSVARMTGTAVVCERHALFGRRLAKRFF